MNRSVSKAMICVASLAVLATLADSLAGSAMAQTPDAACVLPSEPESIPTAIDAASAPR